ncbi:MerC domain-containing protein [Erythrobacter sp. HL-111]|uniref:MerC domain-containing protein n=1 Tax=Erythrobacter sp. HL-111 TaxID=1798193 RepID=UPI0006D97083|nr:MerC domain-containing protein [Erythrobacter sp. HL-111]KPP93194.1 MAG: MerC mercury resistance protein [Erythrobacteraceae bacterium HL-111]SDR92879.1 MerC mercury resistance protein [Erythrobacter sp. HL-111]
MKNAAGTRLLDRFGIALSGLCLVHCLALPVALALLPVLSASALGRVAEAEWLHAVLLVPVVLVSGWVLGRRAIAVRWLGPILLLAFGAMGGALLVGEEWQEQALTIGGASLLILAHAVNLRARALEA